MKDKAGTRFHGRVEANGRACAQPGCDAPGEFRAPYPEAVTVGRDGPAPFRWLCLDHVRAFNSGYNFFSGMSADEIHRRGFAGEFEPATPHDLHLP